ncbi:MAG: LPS assembly lipoprotein LptE [Acidobacteria bacterium]|nr:LPS assembly lipoprotein LptE [Acidobacteriota bacterium]
MRFRKVSGVIAVQSLLIIYRGRFDAPHFAVCTLTLALRTSTVVLLLLFLANTGCGYRLAGRATAIPANVDSVAIPIFTNKTTKYRLEQRLTSAVVDEFIARTRYRVIPDPSQAKALLTGEVTEFTSTPVIFAGGAGATFLVTVRMRVTLKDTATQKLLFENNNFYFREEFEISRGSREFFPEEGPAMDRLAREFSRTLVSSILEAF